MTVAASRLWTIVAVATDGDEAQLEESAHSTLSHLLGQAVRRLYGDHAVPGEYEILVNGVVQSDLDVSLEKAGLHDGSEVVVQPKNVSRG